MDSQALARTGFSRHGETLPWGNLGVLGRPLLDPKQGVIDWNTTKGNYDLGAFHDFDYHAREESYEVSI